MSLALVMECVIVMFGLFKKSGKNLKTNTSHQTSDDTECTGIICKIWPQCHHPELCQEECFDADLSKVDPRFAETKYVVEANSFEVMSLWNKHAKKGMMEYVDEPKSYRVDWVQDYSGVVYQLGELNGMPMMVTFFWNVLNGVRVVFYESTGYVTDTRIIEQWLDQNCDPKTHDNRPARTDAMNFQHVLQEIEWINNNDAK